MYNTVDIPGDTRMNSQIGLMAMIVMHNYLQRVFVPLSPQPIHR